jgi:hypothetical protein
MKESAAIAKEANRKEESSPTRGDNNIQRLRNEPERQLGSLRDVIGNIRRNGGTPSVESISTELSVMPSSYHAPVLLALQRTHGNRYVQRVVAGIQAKLKVGQPGDVYEQEADRVADLVIRMPEPRVRQPEEEEKEGLMQTPLAEQITPLVQRQVEPERGEKEGEEILQPKEVSGQTPEDTPDLESRIQSMKSSGQPLPETDRSFMERGFGVDFSGVRMHTNSEADQLNKELNAQAFTYGRDIYFGAGRYTPGTSSGKRLLAHELTHVVQQGSDLQNISFAVVQRDIYDLLITSITPEYARALSDDELEEQVQFLRNEMRSNPDPALSSNLEILEAEAFRRLPSVEIISADVAADSISIRLEPPDRSGDFTLELLGPAGSHVIRREVRCGGIHNDSFDIPSLAGGEYDNIRATWGGIAYNDPHPYHIHVLGVYRHSQYNIPHENTCVGPAVDVYITDSDCNFTQAVLRQQFVNQVNLNGSGVSIAHGNLRREAFCLSPVAPADAINRSFRRVADFHGSCNGNTGALNNSTVARLPAHRYLTCDDRVHIHTVGIKTVTDLCPGCAQAQLDNFTTDAACAGIRDLGNFMTIKLF